MVLHEARHFMFRRFRCGVDQQFACRCAPVGLVFVHYQLFPPVAEYVRLQTWRCLCRVARRRVAVLCKLHECRDAVCGSVEASYARSAFPGIRIVASVECLVVRVGGPVYSEVRVGFLCQHDAAVCTRVCVAVCRRPEFRAPVCGNEVARQSSSVVS